MSGFLVPHENRQWDLHNIEHAGALLQGTLLGMHLNIASSVLLQLGDHKAYFFYLFTVL